MSERVADGGASTAGALGAEASGSVPGLDVIEHILKSCGAAAGGTLEADAAGVLPVGCPGELYYSVAIT